MSSAKSPGASGQIPDTADGPMEEGRRYWKAAIAHLAPEKREAAWEFYLDRLESSAAADTLGGVMLLLEAHLAFFDDLPARLGRAAQQIEAITPKPSQLNPGHKSTSAFTGPAATISRTRRWSIVLVAGLSAAVGGVVACMALLAVQHRGTPAPADISARPGRSWLPLANSVRVEPWNDATIHRRRGAIISLDGVAWTERTASGGATIYMLSPVEEVRRDLEALRKTSD